jgi:enoyl-CoA hydratase/carnithine racemase
MEQMIIVANDSEIEILLEDRVCVISMKRPAAGNRLTASLKREMIAAFEKARNDTKIGACVLTGYGDVFCLGGDYQGAGAHAAGRLEFGRAYVDLFQAMARLGKPLIGAINGNAHAGGMSLVVGCDMAVVAHDATLGLPETAKGLFPLLALAAVRDALPQKVLFEIIYSARLMDAAEALRLHLVNEIAPRGEVLSRAVAIARTAAQLSPSVMTVGRDLYYSMRNAPPAEALEQSRFALLAALSAAGDPPLA